MRCEACPRDPVRHVMNVRNRCPDSLFGTGAPGACPQLHSWQNSCMIRWISYTHTT